MTIPHNCRVSSKYDERYGKHGMDAGITPEDYRSTGEIKKLKLKLELTYVYNTTFQGYDLRIPCH